MKAFLLAAGNGTRLKPLTDVVPKCLLPIRGIPMLRIWLDTCEAIGINEVLINSHSHSHKVREFLNQSRTSVSVHLVEEDELQGSAGTIFRNREWVSAEQSFWVFYADVLNRINLPDMMKVHQVRKPAATIAAHRVPDPRRCGIIIVDDKSNVQSFVEKPEHPMSDLAFSGIAIGTPALLDEIPSAVPSDLGFDVFPRLSGNMVAYESGAYLLDIGTMANYQLAQATWPGMANDGDRAMWPA